MVSKMRTVRVDDDLWQAAQAVAKSRGESISSDVLRPALELYVERFAVKGPRYWLGIFNRGSERPVPNRKTPGTVVCAIEEPEDGFPHEWIDPVDSQGMKMSGRWLLKHKNADLREIYYDFAP